MAQEVEWREGEVALRLADEGVPLRAIARATKIPSGELREWLRGARAEGRLVDLPADDWPPGYPREERALQLSRLVVENKEALLLGMQRVFGLTRTQAGQLLDLLMRESVCKARADKAANTVNVHMCEMRKRLGAFGIRIVTLWGYGYQLLPEDRRRAMDLIMARVGAGASV